MFEGNGDLSEKRESFNADWCEETDEIRDFLMLHYVVNSRNTDSFWLDRKTCKLPNSLQNKLNELNETGWVDLPEHALFGHDSWFQVLVGQGFEFEYSKFAAEPETAKKYIGYLQNLAQAVRSEIAMIPRSHEMMLKEMKAIS